MNEEDELVKQISQFTIGNLDEALSQQLTKTHITSTTAVSASTINTPTVFNDTQQPSSTQWSSMQTVQSRQVPSWQNTTPTTVALDDDAEGWGDAPPYTAILQNTHFGFSSIMLPSQSRIPVTEKTQQKELDPNQPFNRFRHKPVSFNSPQ